ncbi:hypothetical protein IQ266_04140 [filamentous cyanobacterium LEGE 11480]|uniref:Filament integrity protein n=1 Tax=Romeriopsis navalis LEGE 11480 TaxID=2777977 RepID=A0A928Z2E1_9CYAN|nr:filament integrity protein FraC [Romeriopsis navalis]MBE9028952.1 hypothetical protein [Romeriopsis navalis LEGE 11480]
MLWTGVLPLRAVAFQILFLLIAIAIEGMILRSRLGLKRKESMEYAVVVNLLSTILGWMLFFLAEPFFPEQLRTILMEYIFFGGNTFPPTLVIAGFSIFIATFLLKLQGMAWLDAILGRTPPTPTEEDRNKFRGRKRRHETFKGTPSRSLAVLWANACSFSAISILLALQIFGGAMRN